MNKLRIFKVLNSFLILMLVIAMFFAYSVVVNAAGIGTVKQTYSRTIMDKVTYTYTQSDNGSPQRNYVLEYDPVNSGVEALAVFGEYEFGGDTISTNIALAQSRGYTVIAGVNASPFDTSNGVTVGTIIQNGRVISANSGKSGYDSFAIYDDGHMFIGTSDLSFSYNVNGGNAISFQHINKQKKTANNDIYLLTSDFAEDSRILANSCEVVLKLTSGDVKIGSPFTATVESIKENATTDSRTKLAEGKLLLVGPSLSALGGLKANDTITFNITNNDSSHDWSKVAQSICGFYEILKDGELVHMGDPSVHPRTTIGYKADGTIVLWVVDGRQPLLSVGLTDQACAEYMKSLGCVAAIRMDGGGSSNMTIRLPGDSKLTTVNSPSDGQERNDSDALLLVLKKDYDTNVGSDTLLHAYPNNLVVLENTVVDITVKATDGKYNPKAVPDYNMSVEGDCGSIVDGKFKAKEGTGSGKIKITSGNATTYVDVSVTNTVTELYTTVNNIASGPKEKTTLGVKAYNGSDLLECSNESFTWTCDEAIGTIDNHGVFTATSDSGKTGYIYVSHGKASAKVLVTIGALPQEITGFENDKCGNGTGQWRNNQVNGGTGSCSINTDLEYVKFGEKSLKIEFNLKGTTGTVGTQIGRGSSVTIPGTPTAIGMWVYATPSAQGAWIRLQYSESGSSAAKYADFSAEGQTGELHVDWVGWKYLEAPLDTTIKYPISVVYLVRVMGVTESERINGVIYVDSLRAVYGFKNDDFNSPYIENINPESETYLTTQTVSFDIKDDDTGINKDALKFYYDGKLLTNVQVSEISGGYHISWTPSALVPLPKGQHTFKVRFEDNFGNFVIKEWTLDVVDKIPVLIDEASEEIKAKGTFEYKLYSKIDNFTNLNFKLEYDKEKLQVVSVDGCNYTLGDGLINCSFVNPQKEDVQKQLVKVTFKALSEGETSIKATSATYDGIGMDALEKTITIGEAKSDDDFKAIVSRIDANNVLTSRSAIKEAQAELEIIDEAKADSAALSKLQKAINDYAEIIAKMNQSIEAANKVKGGK
ncbi:MAG: phosphodiester glycosidase family protein [Bacilli bacterium]|nr:phosphodiester glycosidase family protein [Bacilli bacterium]